MTGDRPRRPPAAALAFMLATVEMFGPPAISLAERRRQAEQHASMVAAGLCPRCGGELVKPAGFPPDVRGCLCGFIDNPRERAA